MRRFTLSTAVRILLLLVFCASARAELLSNEEYTEVRDITRELMRRFPPSEYVYLELGRSPAPFGAVAEAMSPGSTRALPFTGAGFLWSLTKDGTRSIRASNERAWERVNEHLGHYLPDPRDLGGKKIVIIDYVRHANSLLAGQLAVREYYRGLDRGAVTVEAFGIVDPVTTGQAELRARDIPHTVLEARGLLARQLASGAYEELAPYPDEHNPITQGPKKLKAGTLNARLRTEVARRIRADPQMANGCLQPFSDIGAPAIPRVPVSVSP